MEFVSNEKPRSRSPPKTRLRLFHKEFSGIAVVFNRVLGFLILIGDGQHWVPNLADNCGGLDIHHINIEFLDGRYLCLLPYRYQNSVDGLVGERLIVGSNRLCQSEGHRVLMFSLIDDGAGILTEYS